MNAARETVLALAADETAAKNAIAAIQRKIAEAIAARQSAEADRIAARLVALRKEEQELAEILLASPVPLSPQADAALNAPPPRPTRNSFTGGAYLPNIHTPISGIRRSGDAGQRFWQTFDDATPPAAEAAA